MPERQTRILILAPRGRDAAIAAELLARHAMAAHVCTDQAALLADLDAGAGAVLLTEEALATSDMAPLAEWVQAQPTWSDIPFVVLANGARSPRSAAATRRLIDLGNVVMLERPLHADAMLGAVRSALKARERQYEVRDAAATLERAVVERTAELAAARESLEVALDAAGMGSWDIDLTTGETRRSARHDEIFGYAAMLPRWDVDAFLAHVVADDRAAAAAQFDQAIETGAIDIDCAITDAHGQRRWIVAKGRVRYADDGAPLRIAGVVSDVTERREAEQVVAQAQKMDAIGQLTGGVAHDFNNLLTPIVGSLDMLRRRHRHDERSLRMIGGALQASERAATLTQRLLAFARRQALQPRAVDISVLIDGISDLVRRSLGPTIEIVLDLPAGLPPARVDPNQLELAILNLAINARDAMPHGGRLRIALAHQTIDTAAGTLAAGDYLRVIVADDGAGMDAATLARATEPFFSTKGVGKGTGLGLSMVHGLAAQSDGTLKLSSVTGGGTTVELWLPATDEPVDAGQDAPLDPVPAGRAAHILLVDDEAIVRDATASMLRDLGYVVTEAGSASEALSVLREGLEPDALVTDYLMPGMTGGTLIAEVRAGGRDIPSLLITGYAAAGQDVPGDVVRLAKPFRQVELARQVNDLLARPSRAQRHLRVVD